MRWLSVNFRILFRMEQEYKISMGMQLFYGLLAVGMFVFSIYLFATYNPVVGVGILLLPLAIGAGSILIVINLYRRRIIIDGESIRCISLFSTATLPLKGVKGSRVGQKVIELEAYTPAGAKMVIRSYNDLTNSGQLAEWARTNFKDLNAIDLEAEKNNALQDPNFGSTEGEREALLKQKKGQAGVYNGAGLIIGFCMIFLPPLPLTIVGLATPLAGIALMAFSKGAIKYVADSRRSVYAFIFLGFPLSCFTLLIKSIDACTVVAVKQVWLPGLGVAACLFFLLYTIGINRAMGSIVTQVIFMAIPALLYGYGAVRMANFVFDPSAPRVYSAVVEDRRINFGKSVSYYLTLTPWGPRTGYQESEVSRTLYRKVAEGDTVTVNERPGWLHIGWFTIIPRHVRLTNQ
jgi:hypothetical protein